MTNSNYWHVNRVSFKFNTYAAFQQQSAENHNQQVLEDRKNYLTHLEFGGITE